MRQEFALVRKELEVLSGNLRGEITGARKDLEITSSSLRGEVAGVRKDLEVQAATFRRDLELLSTTMTVRLGSMLVVGFGLMIASLRFVLA